MTTQRPIDKVWVTCAFIFAALGVKMVIEGAHHMIAGTPMPPRWGGDEGTPLESFVFGFVAIALGLFTLWKAWRRDTDPKPDD